MHDCLRVISIVAFLSFATLTGCNRSKSETKEEQPVGATTAPAATSSAVTAAASLTHDAGPDPAAEAEEAHSDDAGVDAGRRRRRRVAGTDDAGLAEQPQAASGSTAEPSPANASSAKARVMGDDLPYGDGGVSPGAVLKKKPLPGEDPWH